MKTLPIFRVAQMQKHRSEAMFLDTLAKNLFGIENYSIEEREERRILISETYMIDVDTNDGSIWAADQTSLWNPKLRATLPDEKRAIEIAEDFVIKNNLISNNENDDENSIFTIKRHELVGSFNSTLEKSTGKEDRRQLDYRVRYSLQMIVNNPEEGEEFDSSIQIPVIGSIGKIGITIGNEGRIIGYNNSLKPIEGIELDAPFISRERSDRHFKDLTKNLDIQSLDASLAYAFVNSKDKQYSYLYPVWAYRSTCKIQDRELPLRIITIPATEFGPKHRNYEPQAARSKQSKAIIHKTKKTKISKRRGLSFINPFEAGTPWIGEIGGLGGSRKNAQGFVDELQNIGWNINFNWGDCNAWKTDWKEYDDYYVDATDFVFYTGHVGIDGWMLINPSDCSAIDLTPSDVGTSPSNPSDRWGVQDLEWMIIAACGPLEDEVLATGGGNVLTRWDGVFDGLHTLMGYGAITFDNEDEGKRIIQYARSGQTLINAWFRTAQEIQPSENDASAPYGPTVYVGAMWVSKRNQPDPINDHLWGYGSVAPDPKNPDYITCMWVPC